jgi:NTP pyrophosphatase (non-canonical NTP hydrolase)
MEISELQRSLRRTYYQRDARRGRDATFRWFAEEVGELAKALRRGGQEELVHEFSDVLAWLASLANLSGVDLEEAMSRYADGCPKCGASPCTCGFVR